MDEIKAHFFFNINSKTREPIMPNITLLTLAGIPGVSQLTMTQNAANNCGAYAIIAAVGAHGAFPQAAALAYANLGPQAVNNNANTNLLDGYTQLSAAAYTVTGILNNNAAVIPVVPELLAAGNVDNSPAAMAQVAMDLGRPAPQINVQAAGFANLSAMYPNEQARCNMVVGVGNVNVAAGLYAAPGVNATHVVCVAVAGGLHWLAQGSDGNFYDPADGSLNNAWAPVNAGDPMGAYTFTGLWMIIS